MRLEGIHHVTAITGDVLQNVDFYTRVLGLRLVGKSVNQDDPTVYHVFYSDEHGRPGADITFFEYKNAVRGRAGAGMVYRVLWRVTGPDALEFWHTRLSREGADPQRTGDTLRFADPEGLEHELVVAHVPDEPRIAEHPEIPAALALQGFHGVHAFGARVGHSGTLLEDVLGATRVSGRTWELRGEKRGGTITIDPPPAARGVPGAGTVHHVAWGSSVEDHPRWLNQLAGHGVHSTEVVDRHFFKSIYFREPGGVLYEIADDGPGFGPADALGRDIILPPWYEKQRAAIEARLTPIPDPRARQR
ncbi:MAG: VOC family protein [Candidatus Eisenbacteria bacterium]